MKKSMLAVKSVRLVTEKRMLSHEELNTPEKVVEFLKKDVGKLPREIVMAMYLDNVCHPVSLGVISMGSINETAISAQQIFQLALLCNASSCILIHNHPSTNCIPSKDDIRATKQLITAGQIMQIPILDHIIIGGDCHLSMREKNYVDFDDKDISDQRVKTMIGR